MQRIDSIDGLFHEGNPATGQKGTKVTKEFLNSLQEEIANTVEGAGLVLDSEEDDQLLKALKSGRLHGVVYADQYATLAEADAAALAAGKLLVISTIWPIPVAATVNASFQVLPGGGFTVDGALNINGAHVCPLFQIYFGNGTVIFGPGSAKEVFPQAWGQKGDQTGTSDRLQLSINSAVNSSIPLFIPEGRYKITANLTLPPVAAGRQITISGAGQNTLLIGYKSLGVTKIWEFGQSVEQGVAYAHVSNLAVSGSGDGTADATTFVNYGLHAPYLSHSNFKNIWGSHCAITPMLVENGWSNDFDTVQCMYSTIGFIGKLAFNQNSFRNCKFWLNQVGLFIGSGLANVADNCLFESNAKTGIFAATAALTFDTCYFEGNAKVSGSGIWPAGTTAGISVTTPATTIKADVVLDGGSTLPASGLPTSITLMAIFAASQNVTLQGCSTAVYADAAESFVYVIGAAGLNIINCYNTTTSVPLVKTYQNGAYSRLSNFTAADNRGFSKDFVFDNPTDGRRAYSVLPESIILKAADKTNYAETDFNKWVSSGGPVGTFTRKNIADRFGRKSPVWALNYANVGVTEIRGFQINPADYPQNIGKTFAFFLDIKAENDGTGVTFYAKTNPDGSFPATAAWATYSNFFTWPAAGGPFFMGGLSKAGNVGALYVANPVLIEVGADYPDLVSRLVATKDFMGTAAPTAGDWLVGDRIRNLTPAVAQPKAWLCTVAGTPGTWVSEGNL